MTDAPVLAKHQDDAVLRGLARQAGVLSGAVKDALLLNSFYRAIGLRLRTRANDDPARRFALESDDRLNDTIVPLINRGMSIPTKESTIVFAPGGRDPVRRLRVVELDRNWDDATVAPLGVVEIGHLRRGHPT